jgi:hypothetical protein
MGMDLIPRNPIDSFHFNLWGWRKVREFLYLLGCDLTEFSGSNDGDRVKAKTCRDITKRIKTAYEAGDLVEYHREENCGFSDDKPHLGVHQHAILRKNDPGNGWIVDRKNRTVTLSPGVLEHLETPSAALSIPDMKGLKPWDLRLKVIEARLKGQDFSDLIKPPVINWDDKDEWSVLNYYLEFADFCENCGGFRQC